MSTMLYRRLPHVRVEWRDAAFGGIIALILFESGKHLFCWFTGASAQTDIIYAIAGVWRFKLRCRQWYPFARGSDR